MHGSTRSICVHLRIQIQSLSCLCTCGFRCVVASAQDVLPCRSAHCAQHAATCVMCASACKTRGRLRNHCLAGHGCFMSMKYAPELMMRHVWRCTGCSDSEPGALRMLLEPPSLRLNAKQPCLGQLLACVPPPRQKEICTVPNFVDCQGCARVFHPAHT